MTQSLNPITITQALSRLRDIKDLVADRDYEAAEAEQNELYLSVLHTIANAPALADKRQLKRLAAVALEAHEIRVKNP